MTANIPDKEINKARDGIQTLERYVVKFFNHMRRTFREHHVDLEYQYVIEPRIAKGIPAALYVDRPDSPRHFDLHGTIRITDVVKADLITTLCKQNGYRKMRTGTPLKMSTGRSTKTTKDDILLADPGPGVFGTGLSILFRPIYDIAGWETYCTKFIFGTTKLHADIVGPNAAGQSHRVTRDAIRCWKLIRAATSAVPAAP